MISRSSSSRIYLLSSSHDLVCRLSSSRICLLSQSFYLGNISTSRTYFIYFFIRNLEPKECMIRWANNILKLWHSCICFLRGRWTWNILNTDIIYNHWLYSLKLACYWLAGQDKNLITNLLLIFLKHLINWALHLAATSKLFVWLCLHLNCLCVFSGADKAFME